ncbi:MAG: tRNA 4-thiouridine(8) synthase ThiI [Termitinemataceae bacterium]|nr:MAG: tRNA 4-thiouridine(8) synthase ThiI [Termitinemataceae bacterium]
MQLNTEKKLYLLKLGELTLKGGNQREFVRMLLHNLATMLRGTGAQINNTDGRFYVNCAEEVSEKVEFVLNHLAGITGWAAAHKAEKNIDSVLCAIIEEAKLHFSKGARTFKIESRRTDKSFPLNSHQISCTAGDAVLKAISELKVDIHKPDVTIYVEVREKTYIYGAANTKQNGLRGLPVGTSGRGMLLLSGGIDSPVAGFLMALRGMKINAVYFHSYPYTSNQARDKVIELAKIVGAYTVGINLNIVSITEIQQKIKERSAPEWSTIMLRLAMMEIASALAKIQKCKCLITGESLSQVASQTIENITCTESRAALPVLRPLIGLDKEAITKIARRIGTYETSILPFADCCVLFSPPHPVLRGNVEEANKIYDEIGLPDLIEEAVASKTKIKCGFYE